MRPESSASAASPEALAAARALIGQKGLSAEDIAKQSMAIAAGICVYTNENITIEAL